MSTPVPVDDRQTAAEALAARLAQARVDAAQQPDRAADTAQAVADAAHAAGLPELHCDALLLQASLAQRRGDYGPALSCLHAAMDTALDLGDDARRAEALRGLGFVADDLGDYPAALQHYLAALDIDQARGDQASLARTLRTIGIVHSKSGEPRLGLQFYEQSLAASRAVDDRANSASTLNNIGINLKNLGELEAARAALDESLRLFEALGQPAGQAGVLANLGVVQELAGDLPAAAASLRRSAALAEEARYAMGRVKSLTALGRVLTRLGELDAAGRTLDRALAVATDMTARPEQALCHEALAALHKQQGQFERALAHYEQFHQLQSAALNESSDRKLKDLHLRYEVAQVRREAEAQRLRSAQLERAFARLEQESHEDGLTGVFNRRHFDRELVELLARSDPQQPLALALIDVDDFKAINDRLGHLVGDDVLRALAQVLATGCRRSDVVARFGGEEFALLLPAAGLAAGQTLLDQLRAAVAGHDWHALQPGLRVTVSVGVACSTEAQTAESLIAAADRRLYAAKGAGKNCVCAQD